MLWNKIVNLQRRKAFQMFQKPTKLLDHFVNNIWFESLGHLKSLLNGNHNKMKYINLSGL